MQMKVCWQLIPGYRVLMKQKNPENRVGARGLGRQSNGNDYLRTTSGPATKKVASQNKLKGGKPEVLAVSVHR